jgi:hypothetical protein
VLFQDAVDDGHHAGSDDATDQPIEHSHCRLLRCQTRNVSDDRS